MKKPNTIRLRIRHPEKTETESKPKPQKPRWVLQTPSPGIQFVLAQLSEAYEPEQKIDITRHEFIVLKYCLARHRGILNDGVEARTCGLRITTDDEASIAPVKREDNEEDND